MCRGDVIGRAAVGAGVILAFGICLWQVDRTLRQLGRRHGPDSFG